MMNPETNQFEPVTACVQEATKTLAETFASSKKMEFVQRDGTPVPPQNPVFSVGEFFELKGYRFKVFEICPERLVLEPVGPGRRTVNKRGLRSKQPRKKRKKRKG
jgi:hypothetical protein